ncbi:MAG: SDR family NAD(P)-dependent oxidoreductase, partial [Nitrospinae bacterium]|nr:SDR family NAD(P)-dependent oxidoreductase [Nitrospinota bacterium]
MAGELQDAPAEQLDIDARPLLELRFGLGKHGLAFEPEIEKRAGAVGLGERGPFFPELPAADWQRLMDVNLKSMFLTCQQAIPHMIRQGGGA